MKCKIERLQWFFVGELLSFGWKCYGSLFMLRFLEEHCTRLPLLFLLRLLLLLFLSLDEFFILDVFFFSSCNLNTAPLFSIVNQIKSYVNELQSVKGNVSWEYSISMSHCWEYDHFHIRAQPTFTFFAVVIVAAFSCCCCYSVIPLLLFLLLPFPNCIEKQSVRLSAIIVGSILCICTTADRW